MSGIVSHLYLLTRFSNKKARINYGREVSHLYLLTRFSNLSEDKEGPSQSFTPLFTYKVLKHVLLLTFPFLGFTPLFTYKVLKLISGSGQLARVSHLYLLTRFSNPCSGTLM